MRRNNSLSSQVKQIEALSRRLERARELARRHLDGQRIFWPIEGLERCWVCKSSQNNGKLYLILDGECSCPDRTRPCKHLLALALVLEGEAKAKAKGPGG